MSPGVKLEQQGCGRLVVVQNGRDEAVRQDLLRLYIVEVAVAKAYTEQTGPTLPHFVQKHVHTI